jgi:hypothetical protein
MAGGCVLKFFYYGSTKFWICSLGSVDFESVLLMNSDYFVYFILYLRMKGSNLIMSQNKVLKYHLYFSLSLPY